MENKRSKSHWDWDLRDRRETGALTARSLLHPKLCLKSCILCDFICFIRWSTDGKKVEQFRRLAQCAISHFESRLITLNTILYLPAPLRFGFLNWELGFWILIWFVVVVSILFVCYCFFLFFISYFFSLISSSSFFFSIFYFYFLLLSSSSFFYFDCLILVCMSYFSYFIVFK